MTDRIVEQPSNTSIVSVITDDGETAVVQGIDIGVSVPEATIERVVVVDSALAVIPVYATERVVTDTPRTSVVTEYLIGPRGEPGPPGSGGGGGGAQQAIRVDVVAPSEIYRAFAPTLSDESDAVWDHSKITVAAGDAVSVLWASGKHAWSDHASLNYS